MKIARLMLSAAAAAVMLTGGVNVCAESEYKVIDNADLISDEEETALEEQLSSIAEKYGHDVVIMTAPTLEGMDIEEYAEYAFSEYNMGINGSGILFLVAPENRKYDIYAVGVMREDIFIQSTAEELRDNIMPYLSEDDYYSAFCTYAGDVEDEIVYVLENGSNADAEREAAKKTGFFVCLGIAAVISLIVVLVMASRMKTARKESLADRYIREGSFNVSQMRDIFLYTSVSRVKRETDTSSGGGDSGHTSGDY